jgi:hypothetical protein
VLPFPFLLYIQGEIMGLIGLGIALIVVGLILGLTGAFGIGGLLQWVGWLLLVVGIVLAIIYAIGNAGTRRTV